MRERLDLLLSDRNHEILVAIRSDGSELVGWVHVFVRELLMLERHAEIGGLVVAEGQRGRGIGHLLMAEAERWARRKECTAVYVHSNVERQDAHQFYHVLGYGQVKTQGVFRKSL
jgi:GNAT superfamily N-acetyltransferase